MRAHLFYLMLWFVDKQLKFFVPLRVSFVVNDLAGHHM